MFDHRPLLRRTARRASALAGAWLLAGSATALADPAPSGDSAAPMPARAQGLSVPVEYYRLPNGLRVVLSRDTSLPTTTIAMHYHIGWRLEPKGRTGFAHLFEHLMFQETANLPKGAADRIIQGNGGVSNGQTHFDYTNYFEVVPSHVVEPVLWAEADRLRGLVVSQSSLRNQQDVVKNEVRVNVLNRPYGAFGWLDIPQHANENWHNSHNFYGELDEIDAATLDDARAFYNAYYVPRNAVLVVAGDFDSTQVKEWIERYFGPLPDRAEPPRPDVAEPRQSSEKRVSRVDPLAPRPGLAFAYHVPPRNTREWYAFGLLNEILLQGDDSRLWRRLVAEKGYTDAIEGGINLGGSQFDYDGPMLWTALLLHDAATTDEAILKDVDAVIAGLDTMPVTAAELERARTKIRSGLYDLAGSPTRFGLTSLLASFALFDDDPARINALEGEFARITSADLAATAHEYLRPGNRTVLALKAGAAGRIAQ